MLSEKPSLWRANSIGFCCLRQPASNTETGAFLDPAMGNHMSCFSQPKKTSKGGALKGRLRRNSEMQDHILYQHLLLHSQTLKSYSQSYYRSTSSRAPSSKQDLSRSASARPRSVGDLVLQPQQLLSKVKVIAAQILRMPACMMIMTSKFLNNFFHFKFCQTRSTLSSYQ